MSQYRPNGGKVWWFEFEFNGERIRRSAKTRSKQVAAKAEQAHRRQLEESYNGIQKPKSPKTFAAAAEEYIAAKRNTVAPTTMSIILYSVKHLLPFVGKKYLADITSQDIQEIVTARLAQGASNRYVNMDIEKLKAILRRNNQWERLRSDYKKLPEPKLVGKALSHDEEERLLHECRMTPSRVLYPAVTLGLYGGLRRDEDRLLQWRQIDLSKEYFRVGKSKTQHGKNRVIPLIGPALEAIKEWATKFPYRQPTHFVFPAERYTSEFGKVYHHDPTKPIGSFRKAWTTARKRAGIHLRFHDLRHTTVTRLLEAGCTLEQIAPIMGWSAATMYEMSLIYSEWSLEAKRKTMLKLIPLRNGIGGKALSRRRAAKDTKNKDPK